MIKKTRRQTLQLASAALLGGFTTATLGPSPAALAQQAPGLEPWEAYIDEKLEIEMGSNYFQVTSKRTGEERSDHSQGGQDLFAGIRERRQRRDRQRSSA